MGNTAELDPAAKLLAQEGLAHRRVEPHARRRFFAEGYVQLDGLWGEALAAAISSEARNAWRSAELPEGGPRTPVDPSRAPSRQTPVATGPLLSSLHFALVGLVRALTGRMLVPTFAGYGYYEGDDEVLLHLDTDASEVVLLNCALGDVGPLHLHQDLQGMTIEDLGRLESDPGWSPASGVPVVYPRLGVTALRGQLVPHNRPRRPVHGLSAVAALHYRALF